MKFDMTVYTLEPSHARILFAGSSLRGAARGREEESLIVKLYPSGPAVLSDDFLGQSLNRLAQAFFKTSGSVTNAIRSLADNLNKVFLSANSQVQDRLSWQTAGLLIGVVHRETLFIGLSGGAEALVIKHNGMEHFCDPELDPRGLGYSSVVHPRFFQTGISDGELLLLAKSIPQALLTSAEPNPNTESLREFLPVLGETDVIQLTFGDGVRRDAWLQAGEPGTPADEVRADAAVSQEPREQDAGWSEALADSHEDVEQGDSLADDLFRNVTMVVRRSEPQPVEALDDQPNGEDTFLEDEAVVEPEGEQPEDEAGPDPELETPEDETVEPMFDIKQLKADALQGVAKGARWLKGIEEKTGSFMQKGEARQGEQGETVEELSSLTKWLIAVLVPVLIIGIATFVFFSQGQGNEYNYYLAQAKASASNAALMQTDELKREGWNQTVIWLDKAAAYEKSEEVNALYLQARLALDALDGAKRLIYKAAFAPSLYPQMVVSRIISLNRDLYLLDSSSGTVRHLTLQSQGYVPDDTYTCGPGSFGGLAVGALVDMLAIPINNPAKAPILAIDAGGNLIYCSVGVEPSAVALMPPDGGWQDLRGMAFDSGWLYVLDAGTNAIWIYRGFSSNFDQVPVSYFDDMPFKLHDAVDLAVSKDELFLLHQDGHSSHCLASQISGLITCDNPYPYQDSRGSAQGADLEKISFSQMAYSPPPDPSLYYLDPEGAQLYQFSVLMNLNQVLRSGLSDGSLPQGRATAFAVAANRQVFLAFGNSVVYAVLP